MKRITTSEKLDLFANICHIKGLMEGYEKMGKTNTKYQKTYQDYLNQIDRAGLNEEYQEYLDGTWGKKHVWDDYVKPN